MRSKPLLTALVAALIPVFVSIAPACHGADERPSNVPAKTAVSTPTDTAKPDRRPQRDLSIDEAMGGHTLARHVGKSDDELRDRLRRDRQISAASTFTDRATAERAVGAALATSAGEVTDWQNRTGRRPNLVLHYVHQEPQPLGRSLARGQRTPVDCDRALVVLRWDEHANRFFVLTSYPDAER